MSDNLTKFSEALVKAGWTKTGSDCSGLIKGEWKIWFDTSSWCNVDTKHYPGICEIHVPNEYEAHWTIKLIEHLCSLEDERYRLRQTLSYVASDSTASKKVKEFVNNALKDCYHSYRGYLNEDKKTYTWHCNICGQSKTET